MEFEFQDKEHLYQYLEEWLSTRESQPDHIFLYKKEKQDSTQIEGSNQ